MTPSSRSAYAAHDTIPSDTVGNDAYGLTAVQAPSAGEAPLVPGSGIPFEATMPVLCGVAN